MVEKMAHIAVFSRPFEEIQGMEFKLSNSSIFEDARTNPHLFVCLEFGGRRPTPHQVRVVAAHEVETDRDEHLDVHVAMVTAERGVGADVAEEVAAEDGSSVSDQELVQLLQVL